MKKTLRRELDELWKAIGCMAKGEPFWIKKTIHGMACRQKAYPQYFHRAAAPVGAWEGGVFKVMDKKKQQSCEIGPHKPIVRVDDHGVHIEARQGTMVHLDCWVNDTTKMGDCLIMGSPWAQSHIMQMEELKAELSDTRIMLKVLKQNHCDHEYLNIFLKTENEVDDCEVGVCQECGLQKPMTEWCSPHKWVHDNPQTPAGILLNMHCSKCGLKNDTFCYHDWQHITPKEMRCAKCNQVRP
jgi:hypothetical protein